MKRHILTGLVASIILALAGKSAQATDWETDFDKASSNAVKNGHYMLLDFTGSDWCGWCMKLDKEVFTQKDFNNFAKTNLICVQLDFPRQKKLNKKQKEQNDKLAAKYGIRGYPTVLILSPEGELVATTGYQEGGAKKYVESLKGMIEQYEKQHPKKVPEKKADAPAAAK